MKFYIFVGMLLVFFSKNIEGSCLGCVELDEITFDKLIKKFEYALIKFDIAFPYGDKHEAFSEFAKFVSPKVEDLLIGLVGVKDYGEKENSALAKRYNVDEKKFPVIMLFKNYSSENWIQYSDKEELDPNNLKKFVKKHSNLYIGFDGCIESLDILVDDFISKTKEEQNEVIKKVEVVSEKFDDNVSEYFNTRHIYVYWSTIVL